MAQSASNGKNKRINICFTGFKNRAISSNEKKIMINGYFIAKNEPSIIWDYLSIAEDCGSFILIIKFTALILQ